MNINNLPMLRHDLANHHIYAEFIASIITVAVLLVMWIIGTLTYWWLPALISIPVVAIIAFAKENYSKNTGKGEVSKEDFWHTIYGSLPVTLVYLLTACMFTYAK